MFEINVHSEKTYNKNYGDVMTLNEFIECCKDGMFIDDDGFAREIILNGKVIYDEYFYPSGVLQYRGILLQFQERLGELKIAWYNK